MAIAKENFSLAQWRTSWQVPRYLSLSAGDNRLILDLEQSSHAAELKAEVQNSNLRMASISPSRKSSLTLDELWLNGPEAATTPSWSAPMVLRPEKKEALPATPAVHVPCTVSRIHPPGGEWLFAKLYCARNLENDLISAIAQLGVAENCIRAGWGGGFLVFHS